MHIPIINNTMNILYLAAGNYYFDNRDYFSFNAIHNSSLVATRTSAVAITKAATIAADL